MSGNMWYNDIIEMINKEWEIYVTENVVDEEEDADDVLQDFKESDFTILFDLGDYTPMDLLSIQNYLIDNGVNYQYVFDIMDIEKNVVEQVLEDFQG